MASLLLEQEGIDVDISDAFGDTALHYAAANGAGRGTKTTFQIDASMQIFFYSSPAKRANIIFAAYQKVSLKTVWIV